MPTERDYSSKPNWVAIRNQIIDKYTSNKSQLVPYFRRKNNGKDTFRIAVIVSLWEGGKRNLTGRMFDHTLKELYSQAMASNIQLDVFMIANNSGGPTNTIADSLQQSVTQTVKTLDQQNNLHYIDVERSVDAKAIEPGLVRLPPLPSQTKGSRFFYIKQSRNPRNAGKIYSFRDIAPALYKQISKYGYKPDAILQIDAESLLEFSELHSPRPKQKNSAPLKVLLDNLMQDDSVKAISSAGRYEYFNPYTGKPAGKPRPGPYEALYLEKKLHPEISLLSGGCIIAKPEDYIAGMMALTGTLPSVRMDDSALSCLIMANKKNQIKIINKITHLNRIPDKEYIKQLVRWLSDVYTVKQVFPNNSRLLSRKMYQREMRLVRLWFTSRIKHIFSGDSTKAKAYAKQLIEDIKDARRFIVAVRSTRPHNLFEETASW